MINEKGEMLVEHHVKYKELHGVDETVWLTFGEHEKLHRRLRKQGKCNVPAKELNKISNAAGERTEKRKKHRLEYDRKNRSYLDFHEPMGTNIRLHERIVLNCVTNSIGYYTRFEGTCGKMLPVINI